MQTNGIFVIVFFCSFISLESYFQRPFLQVHTADSTITNCSSYFRWHIWVIIFRARVYLKILGFISCTSRFTRMHYCRLALVFMDKDMKNGIYSNEDSVALSFTKININFTMCVCVSRCNSDRIGTQNNMRVTLFMC